jgi:predicted PhzF superfamily epimerase YddE/YHI9
VIDQRTDGAIFARTYARLDGLRLRFPDVFIRQHFAIGAVAILAPEFEASDFTTMAKHVGEASSSEARSLAAFPAAGSHEHPVTGNLAQCFYCSCHKNKMRT